VTDTPEHQFAEGGALVFAASQWDRLPVRPGFIALIIVTRLGAAAVAGPAASETPSHDPNGAVTAPSKSPWIDLAPAKALEPQVREDDHRLSSGIALASVYAGFWAWAYIAWYRNHPEKDEHDIGADGWFGKNTYAGGADKLGHAWATMVLARGGTALLDAGGWKRSHAALISAAMSELLFLGVEWKDYYYYEFSPGDFTFNTLGALSAIALDLSPRLDEFIDFRVEYWPSKQFRYNFTNSDSPCQKRTPGQPSCSRWNIAEDYSGETYLLALHLGAFHTLRDMKYGAWSKFVDVAVGFETRNYKPPPTLLGFPEDPVTRSQTLFLGVTFNAQGLIDHLMPHESKLRKVGHGVLEVLTPPWTRIVPSYIGVRRTTDFADSGGA
jgi:hypothetical protein